MHIDRIEAEPEFRSQFDKEFFHGKELVFSQLALSKPDIDPDSLES